MKANTMMTIMTTMMMNTTMNKANIGEREEFQ